MRMELLKIDYTSCVHNFFPCNKSNSYDVKKNQKPSINFCKLCGIMQINSVRFYNFNIQNILKKPEKYKSICESDQLSLYNEIVENSIQRDIYDLNPTYYKKRIYLIEYIRKMCNNFKFSEETYYQAVEYADMILSEKSSNGLKHDLIAVGCLLLAGKIYSLKCFS